MRIFFFFFNITPPTEIYTLSLHDALPISAERAAETFVPACDAWLSGWDESFSRDRKSTRLNSSHVKISYAVFCLKKKTTTTESSGIARARRLAQSRVVKVCCGSMSRVTAM